MKTIKSFYKPVLALMLVMFTTNLIAQTDDDAKEDMQDRKELVSDAQKAKIKFEANKGNIAELFTNAKGYVIFPNVGKGAYVVGGAAGNGVVYENDKVIGLAKLRQVDVGLQIGGQAFRQVIFFQTKSELERFKKGNFELAGNVSAVVLEEGKAKSVEFRDGIAVVTMPKAGAMIEVSVGGQKFEYEDWK